jgi:hypothetical protein
LHIVHFHFLFFPLTRLDILPAQAALYTTPSYTHNPHHIPALHILPIGPHFSDEHGFFHLSILASYTVHCAHPPTFVYHLSPSLSVSLSLISLTLTFSLVIVDRGSNISFTHYFHVPFYYTFSGLCLD